MTIEVDLECYLRPTSFIDSDAPSIKRYADEVAEGASTDEQRVVRLFYAVRDGVRYDPYSITNDPANYRASRVLEQKRSYCIPKAVLLTALARAVGVPARLGFADVRNHLASEKLLSLLGSDLFVFHGFTEFWLDQRWVKATPAFNLELCERFGVRPVEFDGRTDALFQEYSANGRRHMEYVAMRGCFADLPLEKIISAFKREYGDRFTWAGTEHEHDELFDATGARYRAPCT